MNERTATNRREFLRSAARCLTAGVLVGGSGLLVLRPAEEPQTDCVKSIACRGCGQFARCELPRARQSRAAQRPEVNHGGT